MGDRVVYRKAGLADREAVLDISDNVFEGFDYLPSYYTSYVQIKWNRCYVAEVDGKVVSFIAHFVTDGGRNVVSGGSRTSPSHQKMGINQQLSKFAIKDTWQSFPQLETWYSAGHYTPYADKVDAGRVPGLEVVRRMTYLVYDASNEALRSTARNVNINFEKYNPITSHPVEQMLLSASNRASLFKEGVMKVQANWLILEPTDDNIKKAVRCSYAVATCGLDDSVLAVSFGSVIGAEKFVFSYDLDLFIDKSVDLKESDRHALCMSHIVTHAQHAADISGSGERVALELSLPKEVDHEAVRQTLKPHLGEDQGCTEFRQHGNYIYKSPYTVLLKD